MKFNINDYKGKYVMHCKTEEEAKDFCNYLHSIGRTWSDGDSYKENSFYKDYGTNTVYFFNEGLFSDVNCAEEYEYTILEWSKVKRIMTSNKVEKKAYISLTYLFALTPEEVGLEADCSREEFEDAVDKYMYDINMNDYEPNDNEAEYFGFEEEKMMMYL